MIPEGYKSPEGSQHFIDRRKNVEGQRSTDREMGELVATVRSLAENTDRQFKELYREIEKLSNQFTEYKSDQDKQAAKDYEYMDAKIGKVDTRVSQLEAIEAAKKVAKEVSKHTPFQTFKQKALDAGATVLAGGTVAFVVYLLLLWAKSSGAL